MNFIAKTVFSLSVLLAVSGCSTFGGTQKKVAQLPTIDNNYGVHTAWSASTGADRDNQWVGVDNVFYAGKIYSADVHGNVMAKDALSGQTLWHVKLPDQLSSGPAVTADTVVVSSRQGQVFALDANTGHGLWVKPLQVEVLAPAVIDEKRSLVYLHGADSSVYALRLEDGESHWVDIYDAPALTLRNSSEPLLLDEWLVVGQPNGKVLAIDPSTGEREWESTLAIPAGRTEIQRMVDIVAAPRAVGGTVYMVSYQGKLAAMSLSSGRLLWDKPMSVIEDFVIDGDTLILTDTNDTVWSIDRHSGDTMWQQSNLFGRKLSGPIIWEGHVLVADELGYLHWLDRQTGQWKYWRRMSKQQLLSPTALGGHDLLVSGKSGRQIVIRPE
jgi:outer membrane protein assembly factor BamB